jgi:hypothetical protein
MELYLKNQFRQQCFDFVIRLPPNSEEVILNAGKISLSPNIGKRGGFL